MKSLEENPPLLKCDECQYPADDLCELGEHMIMTHKFEDSKEAVYCDFCGMKLETKKDLMIHRKAIHEERVNICSYFLKDKCAFDAKTCWYIHKNVDQTSGYLQIKEFNCGLCDENFNTRSQFMNHKKNQHLNHVSICKEYERNYTCRFENKCWFKHVKNINDETSENTMNNTNTERVFDILEKFTERILLLENRMKI